MITMSDQFLFTEKYRPQTVRDCILPVELKATFQKFVDDGMVPNLLLSGGSGIGKTTIARAMLNEMGCDSIVINGSMNGNIDTLRNDIMTFASTVSFQGGRKYVILDEADYLNPNSTMPALRNFMEEYSKNCGFILTCNFKNRIIEPLQSRTSVIEFKISGTDKAQMGAQFLSRVEIILTAEKIDYEKKVVAELIMKHMPDWRRCLNELQRYGTSGRIDAGILASFADTDLKDLLKHLKNKDFMAMRLWVGQNAGEDAPRLFRRLYDMASESMDHASIPRLVVTLADYQYKAAFVVDQEINLTACLTEIMHDCQFK